jgi:hypothetical protein
MSSGWVLDAPEAPAAFSPPPDALEPGCRPGQFVCLIGPHPTPGVWCAVVYDGDTGLMLRYRIHPWSEAAAQRWCDKVVARLRRLRPSGRGLH